MTGKHLRDKPSFCALEIFFKPFFDSCVLNQQTSVKLNLKNVIYFLSLVKHLFTCSVAVVRQLNKVFLFEERLGSILHSPKTL